MLDRIHERQAEIKEQEYWEELKAVIKRNEEVVSHCVLSHVHALHALHIPISTNLFDLTVIIALA